MTKNSGKANNSNMFLSLKLILEFLKKYLSVNYEDLSSDVFNKIMQHKIIIENWKKIEHFLNINTTLDFTL